MVAFSNGKSTEAPTTTHQSVARRWTIGNRRRCHCKEELRGIQRPEAERGGRRARHVHIKRTGYSTAAQPKECSHDMHEQNAVDVGTVSGFVFGFTVRLTLFPHCIG